MQKGMCRKKSCRIIPKVAGDYLGAYFFLGEYSAGLLGEREKG